MASKPTVRLAIDKLNSRYQSLLLAVPREVNATRSRLGAVRTAVLVPGAHEPEPGEPYKSRVSKNNCSASLGEGGRIQQLLKVDVALFFGDVDAGNSTAGHASEARIQ
jgi:hypothetical protein